MNRLLRLRPSPAMVVGLCCPVRLVGRVGYAAIVLPANSVGTKQLKRNAVNSAKVKKYSLLRSDFKRGQIPRGPQGVQGIQGIQGIQGTPAPATRLWAYVSATGTLRARRCGRVEPNLSGNFSVTFNQSIVNCAATANYLRRTVTVQSTCRTTSRSSSSTRPSFAFTSGIRPRTRPWTSRSP